MESKNLCSRLSRWLSLSDLLCFFSAIIERISWTAIFPRISCFKYWWQYIFLWSLSAVTFANPKASTNVKIFIHILCYEVSNSFFTQSLLHAYFFVSFFSCLLLPSVQDKKGFKLIAVNKRKLKWISHCEK